MASVRYNFIEFRSLLRSSTTLDTLTYICLADSETLSAYYLIMHNYQDTTLKKITFFKYEKSQIFLQILKIFVTSQKIVAIVLTILAINTSFTHCFLFFKTFLCFCVFTKFMDILSLFLL